MQKSKFNDHFKKFPYIRDYDQERTNNGGFDLLAHPELIEEIHECQVSPALRQLLETMNAKQGSFMSLGCEYGQDGAVFICYIDFSFRDLALGNNRDLVESFDEKFNDWISAQIPDTAMAQAMIKSFAWEYSEFQYFDTPPRFMISTFVYGRHKEDVETLLGWLHTFMFEAFHP